MAGQQAETTGRAVLCVRISDDPEGTERGVDRQEADCREYAAVHENDTSAFKQRTLTLPTGERVRRVIRPKFRAMLTLLAKGGAEVMIAYDLDRAVRDPRDLEDLIDSKVLNGFRALSTTGRFAVKPWPRCRVPGPRSLIRTPGRRSLTCSTHDGNAARSSAPNGSTRLLASSAAPGAGRRWRTEARSTAARPASSAGCAAERSTPSRSPNTLSKPSSRCSRRSPWTRPLAPPGRPRTGTSNCPVFLQPTAEPWTGWTMTTTTA